MNTMQPVTSLLPLNVSPQRDFIVSDPSKLTYFARANAVRAGTTNTWGAFSGLGDAMPETPLVGADSVKAAGTLQTVGDMFGNLGRMLLGNAGETTSTSTPQGPAPADPTPFIIAGVLAVGVGGFVAYRMLSKKR